MEKITKKFDELADKYGISDEDRAAFGEELISLVHGDLKQDGEDDFNLPENDDGEESELDEAYGN